MKQFLFIKSSTDVVALPASALTRTEYTSDTSVSLFFETTKSGKNATTVVVLSVTSGKAGDVVRAITSKLSTSGKTIFVYDDVKDDFFTSNVTGISSITTTEEPTITGADGVDGEDAGGEVLLDVRFDEAVSKGDPLYITGYNAGQSRITVAKADASDSDKMPSIGLAYADGAQSSNGQAITIGSLIDVDTSSFSVGNVVYVASGGGLTNTKPTGSNLIQNAGKVGRSNVNNGEIVVMAIGRSNDLPNLSEGKYWVGNSSGVPEESSKFTQVYNLNCFDDFATSKHYLPWKDINEQTLNYQDESSFLMPFDGRIVSMAVSITSITAAGDITVGIETKPTGVSPFGFANWTIEETETLSAALTSDYHTFHFVFDNASHFEAGDLVALSIQTSVDIMGNSYVYANVVVEYDKSSTLGSTSTEHESNP